MCVCVELCSTSIVQASAVTMASPLPESNSNGAIRPPGSSDELDASIPSEFDIASLEIRR